MKKSQLLPTEFIQFYGIYLNAVEDMELMAALEKSRDLLTNYINNLPEDKLGYRYAPEKWSVAQLLVHIVDTERIFQYRALRFLRNDKTVLPGFEQDSYARASLENHSTRKNILEEFLAVRSATQALFEGLTLEQLRRAGIVSDTPWSVGGLGFAICGHLNHHVNMLNERYA